MFKENQTNASFSNDSNLKLFANKIDFEIAPCRACSLFIPLFNFYFDMFSAQKIIYFKIYTFKLSLKFQVFSILISQIDSQIKLTLKN